MNIIKSGINDLITKTEYLWEHRYSDKQINEFYNYWCFFDNNRKDILESTDITLEIVLYSKYYWCSRFVDRFTELYGEDVGLEQQYKILEEMDHEIHTIDWNLIQMIEENKI